MALLHQTLIPFRTKSILKEGKEDRRSMNYSKAKLFGILFTMNRLEDYEAIRKFEARLRKDGKEVIVLSYLPKNVENFDFHYDIFTKKDFGFWGQAQAPNLQQFLGRPFDCLLCLDKESNVYLNYLLAASKAQFRIGPHSKEREALFELMIRQRDGSELTELIEQIYHYTNEL